MKIAAKRAAEVVDVPNRAVYRLLHPGGLPFPPLGVRAQCSPTWFRPSGFFDSGRDVADGVETVLADAGHPIGQAESVLDLACGCGRVIMHLAERHPGTKFVGCDVDGTSIAWAQRRIAGVEFHQTAFNPPLPFPDASFDRVFSYSLWTHLTEPDQLAWIAEVARVLRPDGVALITTHGTGIHSWMTSEEAYLGNDEFMARLRAAGQLGDDRGFIFVPYDRSSGSRAEFRGIEGEFGLTFQTAQYTRDAWASAVDVVDVRRNAVAHHDAVVVRRPLVGAGAAARPSAASVL